MSAIPVGLRIDVDTLRGTRDGVPALVDLLAKYNVKATFFMSVGPDNMGRNLWRLIKPAFLWKMLRSNGASLYGYDILLRGTAWPGPIIARHCAQEIRLPHEAGHEVGLHAWDHFTWQAKIDRFTPAQMQNELQRGYDTLASLIGTKPTCSAVAGWRCNEQALLLKEKYGFTYNSDCRGSHIFTPVVGGQRLTPQIPVTLPTYDEIIGAGGITEANYVMTILSRCLPGQLNVYTIHAEVEGISHLKSFELMLQKAKDLNIEFQSLESIFKRNNSAASLDDTLHPQSFPGRDGWIAVQQVGR